MLVSGRSRQGGLGAGGHRQGSQHSAAAVADGHIVRSLNGVDSGGALLAAALCGDSDLTAVGGGALRDVLAGQMPDIFRKHIYAVAAIAGAVVMVVLMRLQVPQRIAMVAGFLLVLTLRFLAARFLWNLPRVKMEE